MCIFILRLFAKQLGENFSKTQSFNALSHKNYVFETNVSFEK